MIFDPLIEYRNTDNRWLISDIDVSFHQDAKDCKTKALCPSEIRAE